MTILGIPYRTFKEKITIVKQYIGVGKVEILKDIVYVELKNKEQEELKCNNNMFKACRDTCCRLCLGATDCVYSCMADPARCGKSEKVK
jgi:hypothetical protein